MKFLIFLLLFSFVLSAKDKTLATIKSELNKNYKEIDFDKIIKITNSKINQMPSNPIWHYWLGTILNEKNYKNGSAIPEITWNKTIKSSKEFEQVIKLDPDYYSEINLLDPHTSLTSIWGAQAMAYKFNNKQDSMMIAFEQGKAKGAFTEGAIGFCKNTLLSAAKDSYLFTSGDNYTFSFFYLQNFLKLRPDVLIIDLGLANSSWYASQLISDGIINDKYLGNPITEISYLPFTDTTLNVKLQYLRDIDWQIKTDKKLLTKSNLILKSIIESKAETEEIYFTPFFDTQSLLGLSKHILDQGTIFQLSSSEPNKVGAKFEKNLLRGKYNYLENKNYLNSQDASVLNDFYRYQFMRLIHSKILAKDIGGTISTYDEYVEWEKNKYFKSSSSEIDDYISRIKNIAADLKKTVGEEVGN